MLVLWHGMSCIRTCFLNESRPIEESSLFPGGLPTKAAPEDVSSQMSGRVRKHVTLQHLLPPYLTDDIHLVSEGPRRRLRSSTDRSCAVPRTHNTFGDRSFAVAGPQVWNSLPAHLRNEHVTYNSFRRELKKTYWV